MENKKELSVKEYFLYTLLALCGFAIWYFATSFVIMDLNPVNWSEITRFLVVAEGLVTAIAIVAITYLTRSNQNY
jgi:hypothetical protein